MAKTNSKDNGYLCPQCGKDAVRTQVDLTLDIPSSMEHRLSKRNIAAKDVVPMGAMWDLAASYCPCGWSMSLRAKRFDVLMAENARLRAAEAEVERLRDEATRLRLELAMLTPSPTEEQRELARAHIKRRVTEARAAKDALRGKEEARIAEVERLRTALRGVVDVDKQYMVLLGQGGEQYCNAMAVATSALEET